jgi:hypothetical protein
MKDEGGRMKSPLKITLFVCSEALQRRFAALKRGTTNPLKR